MFACFHGPRAAALAASFSPWVEKVDTVTAVIELTDRQVRSFTAAVQGAVQNEACAIAATIEAAVLAARNFPGFTFLPPGDECRILGCLPVDCLPSDPEVFQTLDLWGIRTLAAPSHRPEAGLIAGLRRRGARLRQLARSVMASALLVEILASVHEE